MLPDPDKVADVLGRNLLRDRLKAEFDAEGSDPSAIIIRQIGETRADMEVLANETMRVIADCNDLLLVFAETMRD